MTIVRVISEAVRGRKRFTSTSRGEIEMKVLRIAVLASRDVLFLRSTNTAQSFVKTLLEIQHQPHLCFLRLASTKIHLRSEPASALTAFLLFTSNEKYHLRSNSVLKLAVLPSSIATNFPVSSRRTRVAMYPTDYDEPRSLDPALSHEIIEFSRLIQTSLAKDIPTTFRDALSGLHDSTSTAFASSKRLQALAEDRFNRLIPARADLSSSPANEAGDIRCRAFPPLEFYVNNTDNMHKIQSPHISPI